MSIIIWGQYPRSESLVQATRDWDRKRIDAKKFAKIQEQDRQALIALQENFQYISTGQIHWDDLMRPFIELSPNFIEGPLIRFFETNTFWRQLDIKGNPKLDISKIPDWISKYFPYNIPKRSVYTFPFCFLFQTFCKTLSLDFFFPLFQQIPEGLLLFIEPAIGWRKISQDEKQKAVQFVSDLKKKIRLPIALMTTFHNIENDLDFLFELPVNGIGIDFYNNSIDSVLPDFPKDKFLISGILNTESTSLESDKSIRLFQNRIRTYLPQEKVFYTHSGPAELLPRAIMDKKIRNLKGVLECAHC